MAPSRTRVYDRGRKKDVYQQFGVPGYWIVEPDGEQPSLTVFELRRRQYRQATQVTGEQPYQAARPFPVTVVPASLVARPAAS